MNQGEINYILYLYYLLIKMTFYFCVIIVPMAIAWNLFALVALFYSKKTTTSTNKTSAPMIYLLKWQYIIDTIFLFNVVFNLQSYYVLNYDLQSMSDVTCRLGNLILRYILHMSSWMQVVICIDRFISAYLGPKFNFRMTKTRTTTMIIVIMVIIVLANTANLFRDYTVLTYNVTTIYNTTRVVTSRTCDSKLGVQLTLDSMSVLMRTLIPFLVMAIVDFILIRHIRESRKRVNQNRSNKKELQFTIAVVFMNATFIFLNFPMAVDLLYQNIPNYAYPEWPILNLIEFEFYGQTVSLVAYMFQITEFWVNLGFNKLFRKEIMNMVNTILMRHGVSLGNRPLASTTGKSETEQIQISYIRKSISIPTK